MAITSLPETMISSEAGEAATAGFSAAMTGACVVELDETGWIRVTGEDRVRWLNGMVTNSVQALSPGQGCRNYLLSAQGRIQGTATAFAEAEAILLETDRRQVEPMMALLDRFIIMDDVELADVSDESAGLLLVGPGAEAMLHAQGLLAEGTDGATPSRAEAGWGGARVQARMWVQRMGGGVVPRFEVWGEAGTIAEMVTAFEAAGAVAGTPETLEMLRWMEGTPRFGVDLRERELPQETGQTDVLHFNKGCYLGQEIVERIRSRGQVNRLFSGFLLDGEQPVAGAALLAGGKPVGELTSVGRLPEVAGMPARQIGLGYVRREALQAGQVLTYPGGSATVVSLPMKAGDAAETASND